MPRKEPIARGVLIENERARKFKIVRAKNIEQKIAKVSIADFENQLVSVAPMKKIAALPAKTIRIQFCKSRVNNMRRKISPFKRTNVSAKTKYAKNTMSTCC